MTDGLPGHQRGFQGSKQRTLLGRSCASSLCKCHFFCLQYPFLTLHLLQEEFYSFLSKTFLYCSLLYFGSSPVAQTVKNLPVMQETWVQSLGLEDFLEKGMATHSSIVAGEIPRIEEPGGLQSMRSQRVGHD